MSTQPWELAKCDQLYQEAKDALEVVARAVRAKPAMPASETFVRLVRTIDGVPQDVPTLNRMFAAALVQLLENERTQAGKTVSNSEEEI